MATTSRLRINHVPGLMVCLCLGARRDWITRNVMRHGWAPTRPLPIFVNYFFFHCHYIALYGCAREKNRWVARIECGKYFLNQQLKFTAVFIFKHKQVFFFFAFFFSFTARLMACGGTCKLGQRRLRVDELSVANSNSNDYRPWWWRRARIVLPRWGPNLTLKSGRFV
jgi:hypothetical protein